MEHLYGGIEAGGTKFVVAVGTGPDDLRAETVIETTSPDETIGRAIAFLQEHATRSPLTAVGIASFGPVDLNPQSKTYGYITATRSPAGATPICKAECSARSACPSLLTRT